MMKPIDNIISNILLQLLKLALDTHSEQRSITLPSSIAWEEVYRLSAAQGVMAIVWEAVERLIAEGVLTEERGNMPHKSLRLQWAYSVETLKKRYRKQRDVIVKLADIYRSNQIEIMILKGYGLSLCYPTPEARACSDIDIWLFGRQQQADDILRQRLGVEIDEDKHHHTVFRIDGVMVENHYDFLNIHAHLSNRDIERELKAKSSEAIAIDIEGRKVFIPNANCHALFLLRHAAAHFAAAEIVLRHITDWAMFVKRYHADIDWQWLRGIAREQNMELFLDAINALAVEVCGIGIELMPGTVRRPELERRIFGDIISPEFSETKPERGLLRIVWYKYRRWWANRWKHRLVYREGLLHTFLVQVRSHLLKPKSITE